MSHPHASRQDASREASSPVGLELEVEVGAVAHGGHCVARHEGRVLFVRHALPGERVVARVTEGSPRDAYWRADAVQVLRASPDRVTPPCPWAGPGRCGGCDFQHAAVPAQRALKAAVVTEQLERLGGLSAAEVAALGVVVEAVDGDGVDVASGLRWRTRVQYAVGPGGHLGLRGHRSHAVVEVDDCRIAAPRVAEVDPRAVAWPGAETVEVVAPQTGDDRLLVVTPRRTAARDGGSTARRLRLPTPPGASSLAVVGDEGLARVRGRTWVAQDVDLPGGTRSFRVTGSGFWQVHPGAAAALAQAVVAFSGLEQGERAADLYAGAGLLTAALAQAVGESGAVVSVEGDARAVADARRNVRDLPQVRVLPGAVARALGAPVREALGGAAPDVVVLDPPRVGARRPVLERVAALAPRTVVHVACDPAALARDVAVLGGLGYRLEALRAFDLFPQTHHVECVARLVRGSA